MMRAKLLIAGFLGLLVLFVFVDINNKEQANLDSSLFKGSYHHSGFGEYFEPKVREEDFSKGDLEDRDSNYIAGITSHHLPTAMGFIDEFYQRLKNSGSSPDVFVVAGPDHREICRYEASTTNIDFDTPFGILETDKELAKVVEESGLFFEEDCVDGEHSINVQAIYIKKYFPESMIMPIVFSASTENDLIKRIVQRLREEDKEVFVIASADFSHYQTYQIAEQIDTESEIMIRQMDLSSIDLKHTDSPASVKLVMNFAKDSGSDSIYIDQKNSFDFTGQSENTTGYLNVLFGNSR